LTPVLPALASDLEVSTATAGQLRTVSGLSAGLTALCAGLLASRVGLRELLGVGLGVIAVSAISAVAPDFAVIALAQLGIGIGVGLSYTAAIAAVADWTTPADRSGVLAIALLGPPIAWIVGMPLSGIVGEASSPGSRRLSCSRSLRWRFSLAECLCQLRRDGRTFA